MAGFYINLDRDQDRRARMQQQLDAFGLQGAIARFAAIDGGTIARRIAPMTPGETGCFHSHLAALRQAQDAGGPAQILEDDILLSRDYAGLSATASTSSRLLETFDILFTETLLLPEVRLLRFLKREVDRVLAARATGAAFEPHVLDLTDKTFAGATSYFVAPRALGKLVQMLEAECREGPRMPYDLFLRQAARQGLLRMGCVAPFVTGVRLEEIAESGTDARTLQAENPTVLATALLRYAFFVDSDIDGYARPFLDRIPAPQPAPSGDSRFDLMVRIMSFMLSERFVLF